MAKREVTARLKKYITISNTEGISVNKAFLFESYLDDTASENSDIDVMIVSDKYDETNDMTIGKMWHLTCKVNTRIAPFLIRIKRFKEDQTSPLVNIIKGIEII